MAAFDKTNRLKLTVQKKPHFITIAPGLALGYRRNDGAGAWVVRKAIGNGNSEIKKFATADDLEKSNGATILNYEQARVHANAMKRSEKGGNNITVAEAVTQYETDLTARSRSSDSKYNATVIRHHLKDEPLYQRPVIQLTTKVLEDVRNSLLTKGLKPATVDRLGKCLKAALNLAVKRDPTITNAKSWSDGWGMLPNSSVARNIVLPQDIVQAIVQKAYQIDQTVGVYFHTLAATGCRESQMLRLRVRDLQDNQPDPRLMMPGGMKGGTPKIRYEPVPITPHHASILRKAVAGRSLNDLMFKQISDHTSELFKEIAKLVGGVDPAATPYAFRHTNITRLLLAGKPVSVVAKLHDTSVEKIESNYAAYITDHSDAMIRSTLVEFRI